MKLFDEIAAWDKKSVNVIKAIYRQFSAESDFVDQIVSLIPNKNLQSGSTWLLKHYLEHHQQPLVKHCTEAVYLHLDGLSDWQAKLHILQCMEYLPVPEIHRETTELFIKKHIVSEKTLIRAWAYSGYFHLSRQYPDLQQGVETLLIDALESDQSASVKARIRNVVKQGI